jgi:hypothetical protein
MRKAFVMMLAVAALAVGLVACKPQDEGAEAPAGNEDPPAEEMEDTEAAE